MSNNKPQKTVANEVFLRNFQIGPLEGPAVVWAIFVGSALVSAGAFAWLYFNTTQEEE